MNKETMSIPANDNQGNEKPVFEDINPEERMWEVVNEMEGLGLEINRLKERLNRPLTVEDKDRKEKELAALEAKFEPLQEEHARIAVEVATNMNKNG